MRRILRLPAHQRPGLRCPKPGDQSNAAGDAVSLPITASDADNDTLLFTAAGLPDGLTIDPVSGTISGTIANDAARSTPYDVTVTVSDGMASASQSFNWSVSPVGVTNPGDQSNVSGDVVSLPISAGSVNGPVSFTATGLPPGLSIDSTTGIISGTLPVSGGARPTPTLCP